MKFPERWRRRIVSSGVATALAVIGTGASIPAAYAATNLVLNPGFEQNTDGWSTTEPGVVITRSPLAHSGHFSADLTNQNSTPSQCTLNDSPGWSGVTINSTYTATAWVKAAVGETLQIRVREYASGAHGAFLGQSIAIYSLQTTNWTKLSVAYSPKHPRNSVLDFTVYSKSSAPGLCFQVDDLSLRSGS
jgi:Carbohydrate binding domain